MASVVSIEERNGFCEYAHPKAQKGKTHVIAYDDGSAYRVDTRWTFDNGYEVAINIVGADQFDPDNWALCPHLGEYEAWDLHSRVIEDPARYFAEWQEVFDELPKLSEEDDLYIPWLDNPYGDMTEEEIELLNAENEELYPRPESEHRVVQTEHREDGYWAFTLANAAHILELRLRDKVPDGTYGDDECLLWEAFGRLLREYGDEEVPS